MAFVKFKNTNARLENRISITSSNSFGFPTYFYEHEDLENKRYMVVYYDQDSKQIGFRFTNDENEPHKFSINRSGKYGANVTATSFFKTYGLNTHEIKGKYVWNKQAEDGIGELYVISLDMGESGSRE